MMLLARAHTQDDCADVRVLDAPRQTKLADVATQLLRDLSELANLGDLCLALVTLQRLDGTLEEALVVAEARVLWDAVVILASEKTRGEWRPDGRAILELLIERRVLNLEALTVERVVLRLLSDWRDQVVLLSNLRRLHDLYGTPFRSAPVVCQVEVPDDLCEALNDLFHWCANIWAMSKHNIDVWLLHARQRALQPLDDVLSGETTSIWLFATSAEEDFS